ncbi:MAG TPA: DUF4214 domain-containing protein [Candidatus Angelobacter sp.]
MIPTTSFGFEEFVTMKKSLMIVVIIALAAISSLGQAPPTLKIVTEDPGLPSDLFYGNVKVKPVRLRPGTDVPITIDDADFFSQQHYIDFLRRFPDAPGQAHWTGEITQCSDPAQRQPGESLASCTERKRANTSAAFFLSPEFQNTGSFVVRVYWGTLGKLQNVPNAQCPGVPAGLTGNCRPTYADYIADMRQVANGIVVNDHLDFNKINANKHAFVDQFVNTAAFKAKYDALNNQAFVDTLFLTTGINASPSERAALVTSLSTQTRSSVVFQVVDGTTTGNDGALTFNNTYGKAFYDQEFNTAFVFMEYIGYLRRNPDQDGYDHWLGKMNQFGNWVDAQMVLAFILSPEYRNRF